MLKDGRRRADLNADDLDSTYQQWFVLKIITPEKPFIFQQKADERSNPEIDHVFPRSPEQTPPHPDRYYQWVWTVWNMQPVKGDVNGAKLNSMPKDFFEKYPSYMKDYDFLPSKDLKERIWLTEYADEFIQERRRNIILWVKNYYDININP